MKMVRRGVFETNSSSSHSISIADGDLKITDMLNVSCGVCQIFPGEFGWGVDTFRSANAKASYCLTYIKRTESVGFEQMLVSVIKEHTGAKTVEFIPTTCDFDPWGYIDHQSDNVCCKAFESKGKLAAFIFDKESILVIDNDNY